MPYYLYFLECSNDTYYAGYTTDMARRFQEHQKGSLKCKYTRSFPPRKIAACWVIHEDLSCVLKLERRLKQLSALQKRELVHFPETLLTVVDMLHVNLSLFRD